MRIFTILAAIAIPILLLTATGCETSNPFSGSTWNAGIHTVSFSHGVADWSTADNKLILKFDLITGTSYPVAQVDVASVTTLTVNQPREVPVTLGISATENFHTVAGDPDATATVVFTRLDVGPLGAVSGNITGKLRSVENPSETVVLQATFADVPIVN